MTTSAQKTCSKCGVSKGPDGFYARGLECRICARTRIKAHQAANAEYCRARNAKRRRSPDSQPVSQEQSLREKERRSRNSKACYDRNKNKWRARDQVHKALRSGRLTKADSCVACGARESIEAHHHDYSKPLDVTWLCTACHGAEHRSVVVPEDFVERTSKWRARPESELVVLNGVSMSAHAAALQCGMSRTSIQRWARKNRDITQALVDYRARFHLLETAKNNGVKYTTLLRRLQKGWPPEAAATLPPKSVLLAHRRAS